MPEQSASLPAATWAITSPKLICAFVGLKPYFSAGISSAAATRLRPARSTCARRASATGDAGACAAPALVRLQAARDTSRIQ